MTEREAAIAEFRWAAREFVTAIIRRLVREVIRETISDWLNPRQQHWEAFTAIQSITPRKTATAPKRFKTGGLVPG